MFLMKTLFHNILFSVLNTCQREFCVSFMCTKQQLSYLSFNNNNNNHNIVLHHCVTYPNVGETRAKWPLFSICVLEQTIIELEIQNNQSIELAN